jgi:hypothetical protein
MVGLLDRVQLSHQGARITMKPDFAARRQSDRHAATAAARSAARLRPERDAGLQFLDGVPAFLGRAR